MFIVEIDLYNDLHHKNKSLAKDVMILTSVPLVSQIFGILLTPIVTRLYGPEAFGLQNILGSVAILFAIFSTMGYHGAIILPKNNSTAENILLLCFTSTVVITIISFCIVTLFEDILIDNIGAPELLHYLWLTPIFVFLHGIYQTLRFWKTRSRSFKSLAISRISEIVMRKSYQIPAGFMGYATATSLIFAELTASFLKCFVLFKNMDLESISFKKHILLRILAVAKRYRKFPQYSVWGEFFSRLPAIIISFSIIKYFGQDMLGYYGLSLMVLALPSTLISGSVSEAILPRLAMAKHEGKHTELLEKIYVRLIVIMIFPFMILGIYSDRLFPIVFGSDWVHSGMIAQVLTFRFFIEIAFLPVLSLVDIMEKQELHIIRSLASSVIAAAALILGVYYNNFYLALWCLVILEGTFIIIIGGYMMRLINFPFLFSIKQSSKYLLLAFFLGMSLLLTNYLLSAGNFFLLVSIGTAFLIYYTIIAYLDREMMRAFTQSIKSFIKI